MRKKSPTFLIKTICIINLVLLVGMLIMTSYGPWFTERAAVVTSFLWLFSAVVAIPVAIYGIMTAKKQTKESLLIVCWAVIFANIAVNLYIFFR